MTAPTPPDDETEHHVAIVVFATVRAADADSAAQVATAAVRAAVGIKVPGMYGAKLPSVIHPSHPDPRWSGLDVVVDEVREVGIAARNGYLTVSAHPVGGNR